MSSLSFILEMYLDQKKKTKESSDKIGKMESMSQGSHLQGIILFSAILLFCIPSPLYAPTRSLQDHFTPAISKKLLRIHPEL